LVDGLNFFKAQSDPVKRLHIGINIKTGYFFKCIAELAPAPILPLWKVDPGV
jgi:hypothetical protein